MDVIIVLGFIFTIGLVLDVFRYVLTVNAKVDKILKHLDTEEK